MAAEPCLDRDPVQNNKRRRNDLQSVVNVYNLRCFCLQFELCL